MGASAAAAGILVKEKHIVAAFRQAGALEASWEALRGRQRRIALLLGLLVLALVPLLRG